MRIVAKNRKKPTHYRIEVPDADPPERWVEAALRQDRGGGSAEQKKTAASKPVRRQSYVLAISWQPAFCEANSRKRECRSQIEPPLRCHALHPARPVAAARHQHLLRCERGGAAVPPPDGRWSDLPPLRLDAQATEGALEEAMPGSQSYLDRHEWIKHGTCYPAREPEAYYRDSLRLLEAINASPVQELMAGNIGREVSVDGDPRPLRQGLRRRAGERVRVACRDDGTRRLIAESPSASRATFRAEPRCPT